MKLFSTVGVALALGFGGLWADHLLGWGEYTDCYAAFDSRAAADRAAASARALWFSTDVEADGPDARRATSPGARAISVTFSDGETGEDAATFRVAVNRIIVDEGGKPERPGVECYEKSWLGE